MLRGVKFLNLLLGFAVIVLLAFVIKDYITYRFTPLPKGAEDKVTKPLPPAQPKDILSYSPILEAGILSPPGRLVPIDIGGEKTSDESLSPPIDLILIGTVLGPKKGYAIFANKVLKEEGIFKEGEVVFNSGMLAKVGKDEATIRLGGREFSLTIPTERIQDVPPPRQSQSGPPNPNLSQKVGEGEWVLDQRAVLKALENMDQILTDARLLPNMVDGKVEGFRVSEIRPRGVFDAIGLKNGDILLKVNGYEIDSPDKAVQVISGLKGVSDISLDIIRNGEGRSFKYNIR